MSRRSSIENAIEELKANLSRIARVSEWAELMGYGNTRLFSRHFLRHHKKRPIKVLIRVRLLSIKEVISTNEESHTEIAWSHSMSDEKALYNFVMRHVGVSPTLLKSMSNKELLKRIEKSGS